MTETKRKPRAVKPKYTLICDEKDWLISSKFKFEWLDKIAEQYNFDKFQYIHKFRAFRCYQGEKHLDWIDVNDLALLNGERRIMQILLKHQQVSPKRAVIQYPWR